MTALDILLDVNEPDSVEETFSEHPDVFHVERYPLTTGDFVIDGVVFERKTWNDYANSLRGSEGGNARLSDQTKRMAREYEHAYVLVEGNVSDTERLEYTEMKPAALRGSMASITARKGVPVVPVSDTYWLVDYATRLARKHTESPSTERLEGSTVSASEPVVKRMYGCVDGIGPSLAANLYEHFPSVSAIREATDDELLAVDGIGPKRVPSIREAFV